MNGPATVSLWGSIAFRGSSPIVVLIFRFDIFYSTLDFTGRWACSEWGGNELCVQNVGGFNHVRSKKDFSLQHIFILIRKCRSTDNAASIGVGTCSPFNVAGLLLGESAPSFRFDMPIWMSRGRRRNCWGPPELNHVLSLSLSSISRK